MNILELSKKIERVVESPYTFLVPGLIAIVAGFVTHDSSLKIGGVFGLLMGMGLAQSQ